MMIRRAAVMEAYKESIIKLLVYMMFRYVTYKYLYKSNLSDFAPF